MAGLGWCRSDGLRRANGEERLRRGERGGGTAQASALARFPVCRSPVPARSGAFPYTSRGPEAQGRSSASPTVFYLFGGERRERGRKAPGMQGFSRSSLGERGKERQGERFGAGCPVGRVWPPKPVLVSRKKGPPAPYSARPGCLPRPADHQSAGITTQGTGFAGIGSRKPKTRTVKRTALHMEMSYGT